MKLIEFAVWLVLSAGSFAALRLTPERVTQDLMQVLNPPQTLYAQVTELRRKRRNRSVFRTLAHFRDALAWVGEEKRFPRTVWCSVVLCLCGIPVAVLLENLFLTPSLCVGLGLFPFLLVRRYIRIADRRMEQELETTLSVITSTYLRTDDLVGAVEENLNYLKSPLRELFVSFCGDVRAVSASVPACLERLKHRTDSVVFREWIDVLIDCQRDRTLKDTLMPIVLRLTDVRMIRGEVRTVMAGARGEYFAMVGMVLANLPLLWLLNRDWYAALVDTVQGKLVLGICGAVILITGMLMDRYTTPLRIGR